jgi:hypothetical protein
MANVYHHDTGTWRQVKNLGWLLRHRNAVTGLSFARSRDILGATSKDVSGVFQAELTIGNKALTFQTDWGSLAVCRYFCDRPSWTHLKLNVY